MRPHARSIALQLEVLTEFDGLRRAPSREVLHSKMMNLVLHCVQVCDRLACIRLWTAVRKPETEASGAPVRASAHADQSWVAAAVPSSAATAAKPAEPAYRQDNVAQAYVKQSCDLGSEEKVLRALPSMKDWNSPESSAQ